MSSPTGFVVGGFHHSLTPPTIAIALPALLTAFNRASGRADLLRYAVAESENRSSVVSQGLDERTLEKLTSAMTEGRLSSLDFRERARSEQAAEASAILHFSLVPERIARQRVEVPYEALAFFPRRVVTSSSALVGTLSEIAEVLGASYGFVHAGGDAEMVQREALAMATTSIFVKPTREVEKWAERLDHIQMNRHVLGSQRIRGAYWGTFLAPYFVERLGGLARVKESAPVEKVEELSSGTVYLQLSADVWDYDRADFAKKLAKLERYLEPISLLSIERIATPRFGKWDRSTRT